MMLFTIVASFSPADGPRWRDYLAWRGLAFERFDSIDGILRPSLFTPYTREDWDHVAQEDGMTHLITDLSFARRRHAEIGQGELAGVRFDDHAAADEGFAGFDIIDGYGDVSLLADWGGGTDAINRALGPNALIRDRRAVQAAHRDLLQNWGDDSHVQGCRIASIHHVPASDELRP